LHLFWRHRSNSCKPLAFDILCFFCREHGYTIGFRTQKACLCLFGDSQIMKKLRTSLRYQLWEAKIKKRVLGGHLPPVLEYFL
jgi:hypothetical protein